MKKYLIFALCVFTFIANALGQEHNDSNTLDTLSSIKYDLNKIRAATYLNECAYSLTNIIKSENKIVLLNEQHKLNNAYKWENVTKFESVVEFRHDLQSQLNNFIVNEINKERFKKEFEKRQNAAARDAFLNAISGVQINVNLWSTVSNILVASARAYLD
jgi:hypothetical protein